MHAVEAPVVIIGAGQAGIETAAALRINGFDGRVVILGEESSLPYSRPPLSKAYLAGEMAEELLHLRSAEQLADQRVEFRAGCRVARIDRPAQTILLEDGEVVPYGYLVIATGGEPRKLTGDPYESASNVLVLRTLEDAANLRSRIVPGAQAVIVGGGFIGLEIAAAANAAGAQVTVLEAGPRVLARVTSPVMSEFYQRVHGEEGVEIIVEAQIAECEVDARGDIVSVVLEDGRRLPADFVLVGIGLIPRTELAEDAGLEVDNGIIVDDAMRTADRAIFAVGDVARHPDPQHGGSRRLESVPNAAEQGKCVAAAILGEARPYDALPWFWSDQYDVKLQVAGLARNYDELIVRGDPAEGRRFSVAYLQGDVVVAADVVNSPAEFAMYRRMISQRARVDTHKLADITVPLKSCLAFDAVV